MVKDVLVVFHEAFSHDSSIHPSILSSIYGWYNTRKKTLVEINNPLSAHVSLSRKGMLSSRVLIVKRLGQYVIEAEIIAGRISANVCSCLTSSCPFGTDWSFVLWRCQFLVRVTFTMTINKSQGQTLNNVEINLSFWVFFHGQLYVAIS